MKWYFVKTPKFFKWIYPKRIWAFSNTEKPHLTFDDGPIPEVTPWVLDELKKHNVKATFFCIGENIAKHPEIFKRIIVEGHQIGNHTYNHLNGWKTDTDKYLENVVKCETEIQKHTSKNYTKLFRPPYGKLSFKQAKLILLEGYKILMWSTLSGDFDTSISKEKCLENTLSGLKNGRIIIFHDSLKAEKNLRYVLPKVLEKISVSKK
ncbi:polysaccharide deacetylase family protein [Patiriisocius hiemis]|uniref:Polysaccharide deacetylase family protein n=1 Tax=Patiriisocius hiemis TaxID=3075604 RepID=A0ABU2YC95_9FLAO|nr:polysaccharide deacetylase family protein [Constantimarinum sp. W242]MDT0555269.1 polysaccharide deacetylase family protein [Constantimarinum sp. W242]